MITTGGADYQKKRSMSSKEKQDNVSSTDMVVKPKESLIEMEE